MPLAGVYIGVATALLAPLTYPLAFGLLFPEGVDGHWRAPAPRPTSPGQGHAATAFVLHTATLLATLHRGPSRCATAAGALRVQLASTRGLAVRPCSLGTRPA